jgi:hypothetical protein
VKGERLGSLVASPAARLQHAPVLRVAPLSRRPILSLRDHLQCEWRHFPSALFSPFRTTPVSNSACLGHHSTAPVHRRPCKVPPRRATTRPATTTKRPALVNAVTPIVVYALWTQEQAAFYAAVSPRYLRESCCPKVLLPGNGPKGEPLVRYKPEDVMRWVDSWSTRPLTPPPTEDAA